MNEMLYVIICSVCVIVLITFIFILACFTTNTLAERITPPVTPPPSPI